LVAPLAGLLSVFGIVTRGDALRRCRDALPRADLFRARWAEEKLNSKRSGRGDPATAHEKRGHS